MSRELLARLQSEHAFDPAPMRRDLAAYHVPFGQLVAGKRSPEDTLSKAAAQAERTAIIGNSGCGKSSLIEYVLDPTAPNVAPIPIRVAPEPAEVVGTVKGVAQLIVQTLAEQAHLVESAGGRAALESSTTVQQLRGHVQSHYGVRLGWLGASIAANMSRQVADGSSHVRSTAAVLEIVNQLLVGIQEYDLVPVLIFDDTDRWFADGSGRTVPSRHALTFFESALPELRELGCGLVVAVHTAYLDSEEISRSLRTNLETQIRIPNLPDAEAIAMIILARIVAHVSPDAPQDAPPIGDLITPEAVNRLYDLYSAETPSQLREIVRIVHIALSEACDDDQEVITEALIGTAAAW